MCQVHTGAYVSQLESGKTDYTACHPTTTTTRSYMRPWGWVHFFCMFNREHDRDDEHRVRPVHGTVLAHMFD